MICRGVSGLVKGYAAEKQTADECIKSLESRNETLIKETERLRARVRELEGHHEDVVQREQDLVHQQKTLELGVDDSRKGVPFLPVNVIVGVIVVVTVIFMAAHVFVYVQHMALTGTTPAGAKHQLQTMQLAVGKLFIGGQYFILLLCLLSSLNSFFVILFLFYFHYFVMSAGLIYKATLSHIM